MVPRAAGNAGAPLIALRRGALALIALLAVLCVPARAESLRYCDVPPQLSGEQQDRLLRVAAVVRGLLMEAGAPAALISRSGQNLERFGQRYSHTGITLATHREVPWAVRQLYFACDEGAPRIFDQGLAGFVMGMQNPALGYVSIVLLPALEAQALAERALDNALALRLLGPAYSANAFAFSQRYQNCNQWVAELLAAAWGGLDETAAPRAMAQQWLRQNDYEPTTFEVGSRWLMWLGHFIPWVHADDHPDEDRAALRYRVSMPESIEAFVRRTVPGTQRIELCHDERQLVLRRGWRPIDAGCRAEAGDRVVDLE